jgi:hypothetical protein
MNKNSFVQARHRVLVILKEVQHNEYNAKHSTACAVNLQREKILPLQQPTCLPL